MPRASVLIGSEPMLQILVLTRFLHANRYPPRIKCGAGFRSKTLQPALELSDRGGATAAFRVPPFRSGSTSFGSLADTVRKTKVGAVQLGRTMCKPTQGDSYDKSIIPFRHDLAQGNFDGRQQRRKRRRRL